MYDVLVVGAGPSGSYTALRLSGLGHDVAVLEEHDRIGEPMQCSGIIGAECVQRFPLFDDSILREVKAARLFSPSRREIRLCREDAQAYIIDRGAFDRSLANRAQLRGARYFSGSRVQAIAFSSDRARVKAEGQGYIEARAVVIAGGFYCRLPQRLGLGRPGDFAVGAQATVEAGEMNELEVYFDQRVAPGFFAWLVPTAQGQALAGLLSRGEPLRQLRGLLVSLHERGSIASAAVDITPGGIPLRPLRRTYGDRLLVVGDAAGHVKPTTGGGVYYGLLGADMAAAVLHDALEGGDLSAASLCRYQSEWRAKLGRELRWGYVARRLYGLLGNRQIDYLFRLSQSRGIHQSLLDSADVSFDWHSRAMLRALKLAGPWRYMLK